jgi:hypothetical protein
VRTYEKLLADGFVIFLGSDGDAARNWCDHLTRRARADELAVGHGSVYPDNDIFSICLWAGVWLLRPAGTRYYPLIDESLWPELVESVRPQLERDWGEVLERARTRARTEHPA